MARGAAAWAIAHVRLRSIHAAGLEEGQDGLLGAYSLQVVLLHVWTALHQPEGGMLEEVGSELVARVL
jgi:hypothetical protein